MCEAFCFAALCRPAIVSWTNSPNITRTDATSERRLLNVANEWGTEAYYNIAITPWAQLSPDIQYIDGARPNTGPAWVPGVRLKLTF